MSVTIPSLDPVTDILDTDKIMVTQSSGQTYTIDGASFNKRNQAVIANSTTLTGAPLKTGNIVRAYFTADITGVNTTTALSLSYNGTSKTVKVPKDGALVNFTAQNMGGSPTVYKYLQAYTTLELLYDGTQFVIQNNPVVISSNDLTIYADGLKRVDSVIQNDKNLVTNNAIYNAIADVIGNSAGSLGTTADLDDFVVNNRLRFYSGAYSNSRVNAPNNWTGGLMMSYRSGSFAIQICFGYAATTVFIRTYYANNGWNAWKTFNLS